MPEIAGLSDAARLLVKVTIWGALGVATACALKVSEVGEKDTGWAAVPFTLKTCVPIVALSVRVMLPLICPPGPKGGANVTETVQIALAFSLSPALHGFDEPGTTTKYPVAEKPEMVTALALVFFTLSTFAALVEPTACVENDMFVGLKVNGGVALPVPVPESGTICGLNGVAVVMFTSPLIAVAIVGVKVTARVHVAFESSDPVHVVPVEPMA